MVPQLAFVAGLLQLAAYCGRAQAGNTHSVSPFPALTRHSPLLDGPAPTTARHSTNRSITSSGGPDSVRPTGPDPVSPTQPDPVSPTQPDSVSPMSPTQPNPISPSEADPASPTEPDPVSPELDSVSPTQPDSVSPTQPDSVSPTQPNSVSPTQPDPVPPTQPDSVSPTQPDSVSPPEADPVSPTEPDTVSSTQPNSVSPTHPDSVSPTQPDSVSPTQPDSVSLTEPDHFSPTQPDSVSPTHPDPVSSPEADSVSPTQPDPVSPTHPDSVSPTQPDPVSSPKADSVSPTQLDPVSPTEADSVSPTQPDPASPTQPDHVPPTESDPVSPTQPDSVSPTQPDPVSPTQPDPVAPTQPDLVPPTAAIQVPKKSGKCSDILLSASGSSSNNTEDPTLRYTWENYGEASLSLQSFLLGQKAETVTIPKEIVYAAAEEYLSRYPLATTAELVLGVTVTDAAGASETAKGKLTLALTLEPPGLALGSPANLNIRKDESVELIVIPEYCPLVVTDYDQGVTVQWSMSCPNDPRTAEQLLRFNGDGTTATVRPFSLTPGYVYNVEAILRYTYNANLRASANFTIEVATEQLNIRIQFVNLPKDRYYSAPQSKRHYTTR